MNMLRRSIYLCLIAAALFAGCSSGNGPELGTVTGYVTLDGKPLPNARVIFWLGEGRPSEGMTDSDGWYKLRYTVNQDGALIGEHQVRISTAVPRPDDTTAPELVPESYNAKSSLVREVKPGKNVIDFDIST